MRDENMRDEEMLDEDMFRNIFKHIEREWRSGIKTTEWNVSLIYELG